EYSYVYGPYYPNFATKAMDDVFKYAYILGSKHTINATAGFGGTITPSGAVTVCGGSSQTFTITANFKFMISKILVDGNPITISNPSQMTYTFNNVKSDHTIEAQFVSMPDTSPPTITKISGIDVNAFQYVTINKNSYTFAVEAYDDSGIARMVVKVNGVVQIDKNNLDPTIYLTEGTNNVEVSVYDMYGNYATKSFKVISDTKPPVVTVDDMPSYVSSQVITIKGTAIDTGSGIRSLMVNGTPVGATLQGNFVAEVTLAQGANAISIEATDNLGNKGTTVINLSYAQPQSKQSYMVVLKVNSSDITVNGTAKKIDAQGSKPIIQSGRTLLPIRTLIESLGGTVDWNGKEQKVTITLNGHSMVLWIGKTTAVVDNSNYTLDVAPMIINGRTYLPLRFISEHLGASVNWDDKTQIVTIYYWP
ncbi:MAG: stalk domain-containing protein, partial [Caldisericaceae bacterium]